jgi:hypothetical protein
MKVVNTDRPGWDHDRRRFRPRPDVDSIIRHKGLVPLVQEA